MFFKVSLLIVFFVLMLLVGVYYRKASSSVDDFVLGGRKVGPWLSAFSYGTSYFSAVIFVGYASQFGWRFGISATWIGIANALVGCLLAWVVLGKRTRTMTRHLKSTTTPDFFELRFGSLKLKLAASLIIFVFMIPYTASLYDGLSRVFGMAFNIDYSVCVIGMAALTGVYVIVGGYMATAINNVIQGIIMLGGIIAVVVSVLSGLGGFSEALSALSQVGGEGVYTSPFGPDVRSLLGVMILTSLGAWGLPQMVHKFYAIDSDKSIKAGAVISTVFALVIGCGAYFLGGFAQLFDGPAIRSAGGGVIYDSIIPFMLSSMPDILIGIVVVLIMSASMSTLSALVMTSSSTLTLDFIKGTIVKDMSEKRKVGLMRIFLVFFIAVSAGIALWQHSSSVSFIAQLMGISWGAMAGSFLAPFLYGLYWKGTTAASAWACFIFSVVLMVSNMVFKFIASPVTAGAIAIVAGLIICPVVSLLTKKPAPGRIEEIFSCYAAKTQPPVARHNPLTVNHPDN
ncbi:MAG: sodium:solute symporter [Clostridiales bacterium]|nr:sodium:solute symporter [Clostridiales bacterium]